MEPTRIESLLENGWHLIGQLNQWLSAPPQDGMDRERLFEIIRRLQLFWSKADDLNLRRMARNSLVLELFLERYCADTIQLTSQNRGDLVSGVNSLGSLLQGFEATHNEPEYPDIELLQRLECQSLQATWADALQTRTIEVSSAVTVEAPATPPWKSSTIARLPVALDHVRLHAITQEPPPQDHASSAMNGGRLRGIVRRDSKLNGLVLPAPPVPVGLPHHQQATTISTLAMVDDAKPFHVANVRGLYPQTRKVLMVEASLFYRHLFGDVLRTAGYEAITVEGLEGQLDAIETDADAQFCAIMIGLPATTEATQATQRIRHQLGVHLIGLLTTEDHHFSSVEVDACVLKSHPRHLLDVLERLHRPSPDPVLLTA